MKKILALIIAMIMTVFVLTACGDGESPSDGTTTLVTTTTATTKGIDPSGETTTSSPISTEGPGLILFDFEEILSGSGNTPVLSKMSAVEKADLLAQAEAEGITVKFNPDGSTTVTSREGDSAIQKSDGTWTIKTGDGGEGQIGGKWPDNEYTRLVPKPDFDIVVAGVDGEAFTVTFTNDTTKEQLKAYAAKVKSAGFNIDVTEEDTSYGEGMDIYMFSAVNSAGYRIDIMHFSGSGSVMIHKN